MHTSGGGIGDAYRPAGGKNPAALEVLLEAGVDLETRNEDGEPVPIKAEQLATAVVVTESVGSAVVGMHAPMGSSWCVASILLAYHCRYPNASQSSRS